MLVSPTMLKQKAWMILGKRQVICMSLLPLWQKELTRSIFHLKEELHNKLEEFASHTDSLEEIHENKEQIEISSAYERMPNPGFTGYTGIYGR